MKMLKTGIFFTFLIVSISSIDINVESKDKPIGSIDNPWVVMDDNKPCMTVAISIDAMNVLQTKISGVCRRSITLKKGKIEYSFNFENEGNEYYLSSAYYNSNLLTLNNFEMYLNESYSCNTVKASYMVENVIRSIQFTNVKILLNNKGVANWNKSKNRMCKLDQVGSYENPWLYKKDHSIHSVLAANIKVISEGEKTKNFTFGRPDLSYPVLLFTNGDFFVKLTFEFKKHKNHLASAVFNDGKNTYTLDKSLFYDETNEFAIYQCTSFKTRDIQSTTKEYKKHIIEISNVRFYLNSKGIDDWEGAREMCSEDIKSKYIIPIVVASIVLAFIIVTIILYMACKKKQDADYESL
ncbi:hypothetical protein A3Q56_06523 [Intoshia linei]|uniref:Lysosome-associated membrane glycoprotein 5 n=1 Tax=Intoshia linei TaxID=1819745 RepID=A0A177AUT4_9BILA|nr:hypothetical protein A3Q56_06523 [Intoshia linei]